MTRKFLLLVLCMAVLVVQSSLGLAKKNIYSEDEAFIGHAKQYVEKLNAKKYTAVYKDFTAELQARVPEKAFIGNTESLFVKAGSFKKIDAYNVIDGVDGSKMVVVSTEYRNENMKLSFVFDKDFAISGFDFAFYVPEGSYVETDEQLKARGERYVKSLFLDKNSAVFYKDASPDMKKELSEKALQERTDNALGVAGDFIKVTDRYVSTTRYGYKKVSVYSEHESKNIVFTMILNGDGKVGKFSFDVFKKYSKELIVSKESYRSDELVKKSFHYMETLNSGDLDTLFAGLSKEAKAVSSLDDFAPIWHRIYDKAGKIEHFVVVLRSQGENAKNTVEILTQCENERVLYVFVYDGNDELEFFNIELLEVREAGEV